MYTIAEAARRSGVTVPVLRAWERRYGVVAPKRTASGYRLYDEDDIARVREIRRLVESGWSPSSAGARVAAEGVPVRNDARREPADDRRSEAPDPLIAAFLDAAIRLDQPAL